MGITELGGHCREQAQPGLGRADLNSALPARCWLAVGKGEVAGGQTLEGGSP